MAWGNLSHSKCGTLYPKLKDRPCTGNLVCIFLLFQANIHKRCALSSVVPFSDPNQYFGNHSSGTAGNCSLGRPLQGKTLLSGKTAVD